MLITLAIIGVMAVMYCIFIIFFRFGRWVVGVNRAVAWSERQRHS
jgi:hypothetical protein